MYARTHSLTDLAEQKMKGGEEKTEIERRSGRELIQIYRPWNRDSRGYDNTSPTNA